MKSSREREREREYSPTHSARVVNNFEVRLKANTCFDRLRFLEVRRLAHVVFVQLRQERLVRRLGKHALLFQNRHDAHRLKTSHRRRKYHAQIKNSLTFYAVVLKKRQKVSVLLKQCCSESCSVGCIYKFSYIIHRTVTYERHQE